MNELNERRQAIQLRLEELDCVAADQAEINNIVTNTEKFIASLPYTLREGVPQEKLVTLRQCIERIHIDKSPVQCADDNQYHSPKIDEFHDITPFA